MKKEDIKVTDVIGNHMEEYFITRIENDKVFGIIPTNKDEKEIEITNFENLSLFIRLY